MTEPLKALSPDYINPNRKTVSEIDLKNLMREIKHKNREYRRAMIEGTNAALASGFRCGPKQ